MWSALQTLLASTWSLDSAREIKVVTLRYRARVVWQGVPDAEPREVPVEASNGVIAARVRGPSQPIFPGAVTEASTEHAIRWQMTPPTEDLLLN